MVFEPGYTGLFISGFLAATIVPMSSEGVLLLMLSLDYDPIACLIIASISNWLGGITSYALGYLGKVEWLEKYFGIAHNKIIKTEKRINKSKSLLAFFCWLPIVGDLFAVALGYFKINFFSCVFYMFIGKFLRYAAIIFLYFQY